MDRLPRSPFPLSFKNVSFFLFLWLMVGFSLGTSVLIGPVRWIAGGVREAGWGQSAEDAIIGCVIIAYVLASAAITVWLTRIALATPLRHIRLGIPTLLLLCAGSAVWLWMTPEAMGGGTGEQVQVGAHFTFGEYPTEEKMRELKRQGYTAVVSLLHPAVVPFEPKLLADEKEAAKQAGLELIHLPMLPWVSENQESLKRVEVLARSRSGRYYVHCYLGRDRVHLVRRLVEQVESSTTIETESSQETFQKDKFERGDVYRLAEGVYLTPYPTDEEFMSVIRTAEVVVSLMDPDHPEDRPWIEKERSVLASYKLPLEVLPLSHKSYDPYQVLEAARKVWTLPRPVVVHAFLSPSTGRSPAAEAFMQAFLTDLPPLPPTKFSRPLSRGRVEVLAPNVALGPQPEPHELVPRLGRRGVREFVYLGNPGSAAARRDRAVAEEHGLRWRAWTDHPAELLPLLAEGGPWYLYGPAAADIRDQVAERFGPAIPDEVSWDAAAFVRSWREKRANSSARPGRGDASSNPARGQRDVASNLAVEQNGQEQERSFLVGFLDRALPSPKMVVLLGPVLLLGCVLAGSFAGWLRMRKQVRAPYTRKTFHFIIFTLAGVLHIATGLPAVVLFGTIATCVVLYAVSRGAGFALYEAMARPTDAPRRTLFILVPLITTALGGLIGNLLFAPFAYVGYLVSGWGDAVGEPVGAAWGRHRYKVLSLAGVPATRSLEGSSAVLVVGMLAAFLGLWAYGIHPASAAVVALACGLAGTAVEAVSNHGLDNLTMQVVASGTAFWLLT